LDDLVRVSNSERGISEGNEAEIEKVARKLASETFVQNAPTEVVTEHRQRQHDWINRLAELQRARDGLA
jgi:valyl-tRNA synthetase